MHDTRYRARGRRVLPALLVALVAGAASLSPAAATAVQLSATQQPSSEVSSFTLDNGLQVVVIPDRRAPVVTHMLWYKVGSADEDPGKSGIAHFLEHLMFKGTESNPAGVFSRRIAEIGGRENAFTSYDYTAYFQQVTPDALRSMMAFEADRMTNLILTDEVVAPEREVVIEERNSRVESEPRSLLGEEFDATLYQNHPYRIPVIGWMHEIEQLNRADAIEFYQRFYAPNNAVLIVAGDVEAEAVRQLAEETYGAVPRGPDLPPRLRPSEPEQNTARTVTLTDPRVSTPSFRKGWIVPSYTTAEKGEAEALDLLSEILGGGPRSRAYEALVVEQGIASSAGAWYQSGALDATSFQIYASPRGEATLEDVEKAMDAEIRRIADDGVTEAELAAAKKRYVRSMIFARDNQSGMARIYGSTLTTGGTIEDIASWPDRIEAVTAEQVQEAARRHLDFNRAVTGYLLPAAGDRS
ncbi:insulinase family protein [Aquibium carbonis]|uniref:Insulinase family protein n=1 Tax=Aquibium carbonis TaxID=2495581 RepID=A0A429YZY7_9HYPH|nr:pitrilysin family protein [Aquibium carbonis]RST87017.1 insulinase family protein [Aquibium carbonis]